MRSLKFPKSIKTSFCLSEHLEFINQFPKGSSPLGTEFNSDIYETLHIVDIFDEAIKNITETIISSLHSNDRIDKIKEDFVIKTGFWYLPGDNMCYTSSMRPKSSKQIVIILEESPRSYLMAAEEQKRLEGYIALSFNITFLKEVCDKLPISEVSTYISQTLKHEFKHVRTIWANPNYDVLYTKKFASNPKMNEFEIEAMHKSGYNIVNTTKLCYYLNPEESLAFINGIYNKIQNCEVEELREIVHSVMSKHFMKTFEMFTEIINYFDKDYYFPVVLNIIEDLKKYKNNINLQYELYNIPWHTYKLGFFKDIKGADKWNPIISFEEFKKMSRDERDMYCHASITLLIQHISEIKRKLISAISLYLEQNGFFD